MTAFRPADRPADPVEPAAAPTCGNCEQDATTVTSSSAHPATSYPPRGRAARLREKLGERDMAVLASLAKLRLASGAQIQRLHVPDGSPATQARRARALLKRLSDLRLVVRLGRRVGGVRSGSSGYVYGLSGHGQVVLEVAGTLGGKRRRVWETKPDFADHLLAIGDVYLSLVEADRHGEIELLNFSAEPSCWRRFPGGSGQAVTLKPDALVHWAVGDFEYAAFVEVDLATESAPTIALKLATYVSYWNSGIEQAAHDVFPVVVWLAPTERRAAQIEAVIRRLPAEAQALFRVGLLSNALATLSASTEDSSL